MIIKNEVELFTKLGIITQYNCLIKQLKSIGVILVQLAYAETYGDSVFDYEDNQWIDEYNQTYTYSCLEELKNAFNKQTGATLELNIVGPLILAKWLVTDFWVNPTITNITKEDLE